ncbi:hypothetical protein SLEP1_g8670 [Rubroshorea leprosula]|uniref:N-acetyltransferase domain-containing protein n=1 Tax=Rubroshorea leprosula TaxID=152421 RepID=A0AAV5IBJ7_9ROSI|nr:hypothetical protein SLEP1_g8670 [Rubroshorea leprosula]
MSIVARSCSHEHTGGVSSVQGTCQTALRSASADKGSGASMGASGSAIGSVDAGMRDAGVGVATRSCSYDAYEDASARWIAQDAAGLASGGVDIGAEAARTLVLKGIRIRTVLWMRTREQYQTRGLGRGLMGQAQPGVSPGPCR